MVTFNQVKQNVNVEYLLYCIFYMTPNMMFAFSIFLNFAFHYVIVLKQTIVQTINWLIDPLLFQKKILIKNISKLHCLRFFRDFFYLVMLYSRAQVLKPRSLIGNSKFHVIKTVKIDLKAPFKNVSKNSCFLF